MISRGFREEKTTTEPKYLGDALDGQGNPVTPITSGILRPSSTRQQPAQSPRRGALRRKKRELVVEDRTLYGVLA